MRGPAEWHARTRPPLRIVRQRRTGGWHRTLNWDALTPLALPTFLVGSAVYLGVRLGFDLTLLALELVTN